METRINDVNAVMRLCTDPSLCSIKRGTNSLVEQVLSHLENRGVILVDPPPREHEARGAVRKVVREGNVDVESCAWKKKRNRNSYPKLFIYSLLSLFLLAWMSYQWDERAEIRIRSFLSFAYIFFRFASVGEEKMVTDMLWNDPNVANAIVS